MVMSAPIVEVGGGAVALQTMTTSFTHDVEASVAEINCMLRGRTLFAWRCRKKDTERCQRSSATSVPIVADVHPLQRP